MAGFGSMSCGTSPFGLGTPVTASVPPDGPAGCRFLDPHTGDYAQDDDTRQLKQMPRVRQQVLLALKTEYGSSTADPTFGIKRPKKMGDSFESEMKDAVRSALRHLTDVQKVIRLDNIIVLKGSGGRSKTTVVYTVIASGIDDKLTV